MNFDTKVTEFASSSVKTATKILGSIEKDITASKSLLRNRKAHLSNLEELLSYHKEELRRLNEELAESRQLISELQLTNKDLELRLQVETIEIRNMCESEIQRTVNGCQSALDQSAHVEVLLSQAQRESQLLQQKLSVAMEGQSKLRTENHQLMQQQQVLQEKLQEMEEYSRSLEAAHQEFLEQRQHSQEYSRLKLTENEAKESKLSEELLMWKNRCRGLELELSQLKSQDLISQFKSGFYVQQQPPPTALSRPSTTIDKPNEFTFPYGSKIARPAGDQVDRSSSKAQESKQQVQSPGSAGRIARSFNMLLQPQSYPREQVSGHSQRLSKVGFVENDNMASGRIRGGESDHTSSSANGLLEPSDHSSKWHEWRGTAQNKWVLDKESRRIDEEEGEADNFSELSLINLSKLPLQSHA